MRRSWPGPQLSGVTTGPAVPKCSSTEYMNPARLSEQGGKLSPGPQPHAPAWLGNSSRGTSCPRDLPSPPLLWGCRDPSLHLLDPPTGKGSAIRKDTGTTGKNQVSGQTRMSGDPMGLPSPPSLPGSEAGRRLAPLCLSLKRRADAELQSLPRCGPPPRSQQCDQPPEQTLLTAVPLPPTNPQC